MYIYVKLFPFLGELMGDEFEWGWLWQDSAAADSAIVTEGVKNFSMGYYFWKKKMVPVLQSRFDAQWYLLMG